MLYYVIKYTGEKNDFFALLVCVRFVIILLVAEKRRGKEEGGRKKDRKAHTPGLQIATNEFSYDVRSFTLCYIIPTPYVGSCSFYGDKHQKLPRKLNTCAFFIFLISAFPSPPHLYTYTYTYINVYSYICYIPHSQFLY